MKNNKNSNNGNSKNSKTHKLVNNKRSITHNITVKKMKNNKINKNNKKGGEAVAAGSYGCVFRPPIRCNDPSLPYESSYISKLMYNDETVYKEKEEMDRVKEIIKKIPNNQNYFLLMNTSICDPETLNKEDLKLFDNKCDLFTKEGITSKNVNDNLKKLKLINMPDGGMEVDDYIYKLLNINDKKQKYINFININNGFISLLNNGIVPINNNKLNHMDIKGNNMLIDTKGYVRLIDWGLACKNNGQTIPNEVKNHTLHFNNPFSNIFYNDYLKKWLPNEYLKIKASNELYNKKSGQAELLKIIAVNMVNAVIEYNKTSGHYTSIISILHYIYKIYAIDNGYNTVDYNVLTQNTIIEYIQFVLLTYVDDNGNFDDNKYFYEVFTKNVDIWGFLTGYTYIFEKGVVYDDKGNATYLISKDIVNSICRILLKYCYSSEFAVKPINVSELSKELESLNKIANKFIPSVGISKTKGKVKPIKNIRGLEVNYDNDYENTFGFE